jgi:hypothetical protein
LNTESNIICPPTSEHSGEDQETDTVRELKEKAWDGYNSIKQEGSGFRKEFEQMDRSVTEVCRLNTWC